MNLGGCFSVEAKPLQGHWESGLAVESTHNSLYFLTSNFFKNILDTIDTVYDFRGNYLHFDGRSGQYYFHSDSNLYIFNSIISYVIEYGYSYHFERVGGSK